MSDQGDAAPHNDETSVSEEQFGGTKDRRDSNEGLDAHCGSNSDEAVAEAIDSIQSAASSSDGGAVGGGNEGGFRNGSASGTSGIGGNLGVGHGGTGEEIDGREEHPIPPAPLEEQHSHVDDVGRSVTLDGGADECPADDASKEEAFVDAPDRATRSPPSSVRMDEGPTDDAAKEEAFVDAPDQLVPAEGRNYHFEETTEVVDHSVVQLNDRVDQSGNCDGGTKDGLLAMEMEQQMQEMRDQLNKTQNELEQAIAAREQMKQELVEYKTSLSLSGQSWQEERERFLKELAKLHNQLEMLSKQHLALHEDDNELVNRLRDAEEGGGPPPAFISDMQVNQTFEDCSKIIDHAEHALSERLQSESTIRELHAVLFAKDHEVEDLSTKLNELYSKQSEVEESKCQLIHLEKKCEELREQVMKESMARDVAMLYMGTIQQDLAEQEASARAVADARVDWEPYLDELSNGLLSPLAKITGSEFSPFISVAEKVALLQRDAMTLIQKHEQLLYVVEDLGMCLIEIDPEITMPHEQDTTLIVNLAHKQLLRFRTKESELNEAVADRAALEEEKKKVLEQLDKTKEDLEALSVERAKAQSDLEQSEKKVQSLKEKLSMAVSKGKSLVQQRDSLKQTLMEKSTELEKCLSEIREKSDALERAETAHKENAAMMEKELAESQYLVKSLQESLSIKASFLQKSEQILSQVGIAEEVQSEDITAKVQWLANQKGVLEDLLSEKDSIFEKLKSALVDFDMPQSASSVELVSQVDWLGRSLLEAREEIQQFQKRMDENHSAVERYKSELLEVQKEVEDLYASLLAEKNVKDLVQQELDSLVHTNKEISEKAGVLMSEKDEMVRRLLEVAGEVVTHEQLSEQLSDSVILLERCFDKIKERMHSSSSVNDELQRLQSSLSTKEEDLNGYKRMLDESRGKEEQHLSEITNLKGEAEKLAQEVATLGNEKDLLQKDIKLFESKVQDLEGCKKMMEEVSSKNMLQMGNLSEELKQLAEEMAAIKNERDMLQKELNKSEEKSSLLREKLSMAVKKGKGLVQEKENWKLSIDGKNAEIEKLKSEVQLLESAIHEYKVQISNLSGDLTRIPDLESDLVEIKNQKVQVEGFLVESNHKLQRVMDSLESISLPADFSSDNPLDRVKFIVQCFHESHIQKESATEELQRAREEVKLQALKLVDAHAAIESLEDALSKAETNLSSLHEEKEKAELANEKIVGDLQTKLSACMEQLAETQSRLEKQTLEIDDTLKYLEDIKINSKRVIQLLTKRSSEIFDGLRAMDCLLQEIVSHISQMKDAELLDEKDVTLRSFESGEEIASGINCDHHLNDKTSVHEMGMGESNVMDEISFESSQFDVKLLSDKFDSFSTSLDQQIGYLIQLLEKIKDKVVSLLDSKEYLRVKTNDLEAYKKETQSTVSVLQKNIDILLSACTEASHELRNIEEHDVLDIKSTVQLTSPDGGMFSLLAKPNNDEEPNQRECLSSDDCVKVAESLLLSVRDVRHKFQHLQDVDERRCKETEGMQNKILDVEQALESALQERNLSRNEISKLEEVLEALQDKSREVGQALDGALQEKNLSETKISMLEDDNKELQNKLMEVQHALDGALQERNTSQAKICQMEDDLEKLQISCQKSANKVADYQKIENSLREKEVELSSLYQTSVKDQAYMQSEAQIAALCEKVQQLDIDYPKTLESSMSQSPMDKIFYLLDYFPKLQKMVSTCINEEKELKAVLAAQNHDLAHLKQEYEQLISNNEDMARKTSDLTDLMSGMEKIIQKLGGNDILLDKKQAGAKSLLQILEGMIRTLIVDNDNSKITSQEMDAKLQSLEMKIDDLSAKNKLLEASRLPHEAPAYVIQERSGFEASTSANGSEISEIEVKGPQIKSSIPSTSPAAHVRTMYKGSSEHLALNIDTESDRLVNHLEDDDKGHVFKSLNTTGLIPKQAKLVADRIDGIWVSGGRILMRRPGARISLITYWILVHVWVLATIF
ncbi:trans-Golgi network-localized SYP41-interacting protein 1 isoform X2 [Nymphaea colorata]|uniref:trans-Golgi network-localized SYP41-interacting protein 1 isoform X2 n=1 Tax=Nymphaea colorata TaxID=210225 RepID=UPI00129E930F|nr:trans-Golgi network-localized SYP41-interacting protein 1 isoform X2 [Nymphaea colorata]